MCATFYSSTSIGYTCRKMHVRLGNPGMYQGRPLTPNRGFADLIFGYRWSTKRISSPWVPFHRRIRPRSQDRLPHRGNQKEKKICIELKNGYLAGVKVELAFCESATRALEPTSLLPCRYGNVQFRTSLTEPHRTVQY